MSGLSGFFFIRRTFFLKLLLHTLMRKIKSRGEYQKVVEKN